MTFNWDDKKNDLLRDQRDISFEEIVICISDNRVVDVLQHPSPDKYPNQYLYLVEYRNYTYVVPHVYNKEKNEVFLRTILFSANFSILLF